MKVMIELKHGPQGREPCEQDFDEDLNALERAARGQPLNDHDQMLVIDIAGIIRGVQQQVKHGGMFWLCSKCADDFERRQFIRAKEEIQCDKKRSGTP